VIGMIDKITQTIEKYGLLDNDERIVVALSGGPDSTALLVALSQIASRFCIHLIVAHFNHGLRGNDADEDESFSRKLAERLGWAFITKKMQVKTVKKGISPEDYYRQQRYEFLEEVAHNHHARKIALGHNLQDQAETVLLHLLRGSGPEGLQGILPLRDAKFIRPLIEVTREEIISFLKVSKTPYRIDTSNENKLHLRNKIRLDLLPYLRNEFNPKIVEILAQTADIFREENKYIKDCTGKALKSTCIKKSKNIITINIEYLCLLPLAIRRRLLKVLLEDFSPKKNGISFLHINSICQFIRNCESGKKISLPFGIQARREYETLVLEKRREKRFEIVNGHTSENNGLMIMKKRELMIRFRKIKQSKVDFTAKNKYCFDLDKIQLPLIVRNRKDGDWFQPLGMQGRQKLKSFFIDHKITRKKRNEVILLADQQSVIWIENMHLSDRVKITPQTKNILEIEII
jgi:tRNA(Ile)-lysidine synthase